MPVFLDVESRLDKRSMELAAREISQFFNRAGAGISKDLSSAFSKGFGAFDSTAVRAEMAKTAAAAQAMADAEADAARRMVRSAGEVEVAQRRAAEMSAKYSAESSQAARAQVAVADAQAKAARDQRVYTDAMVASEAAHRSNTTAMNESAAAAGVAGRAFNALGVGSTAVLGVTMFETTKKAADFEQQMTKLHAAAGETSENLKVVSDGLLQMAGKVGYSTTELSNAMFIIEKAGFRGADGLKVLTAAAQGANAEQADLMEVINGLTTSMTDFHVAPDKAAELMSKMVTAVGESKVPLQDFSNALHSIEPVAAAAHLKLEDVWGTLAQITQSGTSAEQATENMRNALNAFTGQSQPARDAMAQFGINADEVSQKLSERGLAGTMQYLYQTVQSQLLPGMKLNQGELLKNSQAAADLNDMIGQMSPNAAKLASELKNNEISVKDFTKAMRGSTAEDRAKLSQFAELNNKVDGFSKATRTGRDVIETLGKAMRDMTGTVAGQSVALQVSGDHMEETNNRIKAIAGTYTEADGSVKGFNESQDTLNAKMRDAHAAFNAAEAELGSAFVPVMKDVAEVAKDVGDAMAKHPGITHAAIDALELFSGAWLGIKAIGIAETVLAPIVTGLASVAAGEGVAATAAGTLGAALSAIGPLAAAATAGVVGGNALLRSDQYKEMERNNPLADNPVSRFLNRNTPSWLGGDPNWVPGHAAGGAIHGSGPRGQDSVPAMLAPGEHVLTHHDVSAMGGHSGVYSFRNALHGVGASVAHMAGGGAVGDSSGPVSRLYRQAQALNGGSYQWGSTDCCLIGSTLVYGPNGAKPIGELQPGDEIYSYDDGKTAVRRIAAAWQSKTQPVFKVRTRNRAVVASANHPFLRLAKQDGVIKTGGRSAAAWGLEWARLDELKPGDLLVQPRELILRENPESAVLPDGTKVTTDVAWLLGAIIGDGTVMKHSRIRKSRARRGIQTSRRPGVAVSRSVRLCLFGEKRDRAEQIIRDTWGVTSLNRSDHHGLQFHRAELVDALLAMGFHHRGADKRVPEAVWGWNDKLQHAFLDGYCDADGYRPKNAAQYGDRSYSSCSERLIGEVRAMHILLGDPVSNVTINKRTKPITIKGVSVKEALPCFSFAVYLPTGRFLGGKNYGEARLRLNRGVRDWLDDNDFTAAPVIRITPEGIQDTFDIEVETNHNFIADGFVVHNSGAVSMLVDAALGTSGRMSTATAAQWLAAKGFQPGMGGPGSLSIGWYNGGPGGGHMAATLPDGTHFESGGQHGNIMLGGSAAGAETSEFTNHMHLPLNGFYPDGPGGGMGGAMTGGGSGGAFGGGGSIPAGGVAGTGPGGQSGYYMADQGKVATAQERLQHLDAEIANAEQRKNELKSTAKQSERDRLDEEIRHLHEERTQAQEKLTEAQRGTFHATKSGGRSGRSTAGLPVSLPDNFGLGKGLPGLAEWAVAFLEDLALGPMETAMMAGLGGGMGEALSGAMADTAPFSAGSDGPGGGVFTAGAGGPGGGGAGPAASGGGKSGWPQTLASQHSKSGWPQTLTLPAQGGGGAWDGTTDDSGKFSPATPPGKWVWNPVPGGGGAWRDPQGYLHNAGAPGTPPTPGGSAPPLAPPSSNPLQPPSGGYGVITPPGAGGPPLGGSPATGVKPPGMPAWQWAVDPRRRPGGATGDAPPDPGYTRGINPGAVQHHATGGFVSGNVDWNGTGTGPSGTSGTPPVPGDWGPSTKWGPNGAPGDDPKWLTESPWPGWPGPPFVPGDPWRQNRKNVSGFSSGGPSGTDTVPAWLSPGEFVMNADATKQWLPSLQSMNAAHYDTGTEEPIQPAGQPPAPKAAPGSPAKPGGGKPKPGDPKPGGEGGLKTAGLLPSMGPVPGGMGETQTGDTRPGLQTPGASKQLLGEGQSSPGLGLGGGVLGAAEGAAAVGADAFAPGSGAAVQAISQLINRTAAYGAQAAGIGVEALLETALPADSPLSNFGNTLPGKILVGIAGAKPAQPNTAGQTKAPMTGDSGGAQGGGDGGSQVGFQVLGDMHVHDVGNADKFHADMQRQYSGAQANYPGNKI